MGLGSWSRAQGPADPEVMQGLPQPPRCPTQPGPRREEVLCPPAIREPWALSLQQLPLHADARRVHFLCVTGCPLTTCLPGTAGCLALSRGLRAEPSCQAHPCVLGSNAFLVAVEPWASTLLVATWVMMGCGEGWGR